jgi:hypothetical protein
MKVDEGITSNRQQAVARGAGSLAIAAAAYANVTVYQYILRPEENPTLTNSFSECPYPGLETFRTADARFFAGRDDKIAELAGAIDRHTMIGSIAASGAGKSSLIHAGLIPRLAAREGEQWDVFAFRPGRDPLYGLARSISGILGDGADLDSQLNEIRRNVESLRAFPGRLVEYVQEIKFRRAHVSAGIRHNVLFFVDQWEEVYTQIALEEDRKTLVRELLDVTGRGLAKLVITMRADFMPELLSDDTQFFQHLEPGIRFLGPMSETERRAAIELPAKAVGLSIPDALVTRLVTETGDSDGSLAYLQFVLRKLWEERDNSTNSLTASVYDGMNGLKGAIGAHASSVFSQLSAEEQALAERVIPRLVNVSESGSTTSRRLPFSDFDGPARVLLRKLAGQERRLIVLSAATETTTESETLAEVAHEALLREWKELRDWINDRGSFYRLRNKIEADASTWLEHDRNPDFLIAAGKQLSDAQDFLGRSLPGEASEVLEEFIASSVKKRTAEKQAILDEQNERRASELRQIRRLTLRNRGLMGLTAVFVLAIIGIGYFWRESSSARNEATQRAAVLSIDTAERALSEGRTDTALSMLLEAAATLGINSQPERLMIALEKAVERASSERRFLVPASSIPFVVGNRLYLHVPETGEVLVVDSSGGPKAEFNLPGRTLVAQGTLTALGLIIAVKVEKKVEFWSLPEATNRPKFLARQSVDFQGEVSVEIGLDGKAMIYSESDRSGPPFRYEVFDLVRQHNEVLELGELLDKFMATAAGTSYPARASESETVAAFAKLGFASVRHEDDVDLGLTHTCFGTDLPKALELGLIDAIGSLQMGNEFDADCSIRGDFVHVSLLSSISSGQFRTTMVAPVGDFLDGILEKSDFTYGPIPGRISMLDITFPSIIADDDGYSLVEPQVRSLYSEINKNGYSGLADGQVRTFAYPIDTAVMLTKDTAAVLLAPDTKQGATAERELIFINFSLEGRHVDLSKYESDDPLGEWLAERHVAITDLWVNFGDEGGSYDGPVNPGEAAIQWVGEVDSKGFRNARIENAGAADGEWRLPYRLIEGSFDPEAPPVRVRLSPSGIWYAAIGGGSLTIFDRDGVPLVSRRIQNPYSAAFSFVNSTDSSLLFADPDSSLVFLHESGDGRWVEQEIYSSEYPIYEIDVPARGQRAMLLLGLGQRQYVLRRLNLSDASVWPDISFDYHLSENLPLSDGSYLFNDDYLSYKIIDQPDVAALVNQASELISSECRNRESC